MIRKSHRSGKSGSSHKGKLPKQQSPSRRENAGASHHTDRYPTLLTRSGKPNASIRYDYELHDVFDQFFETR